MSGSCLCEASESTHNYIVNVFNALCMYYI